MGTRNCGPLFCWDTCPVYTERITKTPIIKRANLKIGEQEALIDRMRLSMVEFGKSLLASYPEVGLYRLQRNQAPRRPFYNRRRLSLRPSDSICLGCLKIEPVSEWPGCSVHDK